MIILRFSYKTRGCSANQKSSNASNPLKMWSSRGNGTIDKPSHLKCWLIGFQKATCSSADDLGLTRNLLSVIFLTKGVVLIIRIPYRP